MARQDRTYEIAGTSFNKHVMTFRFADGKPSVRAGVLRRCGHTDIEFHVLPQPMTKVQAMRWLTANGHARGAILPHGHRLTKNPKRGEVVPAAVQATQMIVDNDARLVIDEPVVEMAQPVVEVAQPVVEVVVEVVQPVAEEITQSDIDDLLAIPDFLRRTPKRETQE